MKNNLIILISFLLGTFGIFPGFKDVNAAGPPDQICPDLLTTAWTSMIREPEYILGQTFKPEQNRLSKVQIVVEGDGDGSVGGSIWKDGGIYALATNDMVSEPEGKGVIEFYFNDIEIEIGSTYKVIPIYSNGNTKLGWYYSSSCNYEGGAAYMGDTEKNYDFAFATFGFDYEEPSVIVDPEPEVNAEEETESVVEEESGNNATDTQEQIEYNEEDKQNADSAEQSTVFLSPEDLTAFDVSEDQGGKIKLTWTGVESQLVDGYYVYRSEDQDSGFEYIGKTGKNSTEFVDENAETSKDFYYKIKSFSAQSEVILVSNFTDAVNAKSVDNLSPTTPKNFKLDKENEGLFTFSWDKNEEEDLDGYYLIISIDGQDVNPVEMIQIEKEAGGFELDIANYEKINSENNYVYYLQAKDINGNFSDKAGPVSIDIDSDENADQQSNEMFIGLLILIILLIVAWLVYRKRNQYLHKIK